PLERDRAGMDGGLAARKGQLCADAGRHLGGVLVYARTGYGGRDGPNGPEMSGAHTVAGHFVDAAQQREAATLGTWVFLATEVMFFGPLVLGYCYGRLHFPEAFALASRLTDVLLGTINTAVLLTSSLTMALAVRAAQSGENRALVRMLASTAVLG